MFRFLLGLLICLHLSYPVDRCFHPFPLPDIPFSQSYYLGVPLNMPSLDLVTSPGLFVLAITTCSKLMCFH